MTQEIDYIGEGKNADRFRRNFRSVPWVQTPVVYWAYTSPRIITLGYLPGTKVRDMLTSLNVSHSCNEAVPIPITV